jgi:hypothetical protein
MKKLFSLFIILLSTPAFALDAPTITATAILPNQINLTWSAVSNPGWGYKVYIQMDGDDSRYSTWTDLTASLVSEWDYLPYWVTESNYKDRSNDTGSGLGTQCQFPVFGLKPGVTYNFRVCSYGKTDAGVATYSSYGTDSESTSSSGWTIRYVRTDGSDSASGANDTTDPSTGAWLTFSHAVSTAADKTLVYFKGGTYTSVTGNTANSGSGPTSRIIYQEYPGDTVVLQIGNQGGTEITIDGNYLVFDGLKFDWNSPESNTDADVIYISGDRLIFAGIEIDSTGPDPAGTWAGYGPGCSGHTYSFWFNSFLHDIGDLNGLTGGFYLNSGSTYNVFRDCRISEFTHGINLASNYNALLNCYLGGSPSGQCAVMQLGDYGLVEGCRCMTAGTSVSGKPSFQISQSSYNTLRRNFIYNGQHHAFEVNGMTADADNNLIYNNVIYHQVEFGTYIVNQSRNNTYKNNIWYGCNYVTLDGFQYGHVWYADSNYTGSFWDRNILLPVNWGTETELPSESSIYRNRGSRVTIAYAQANYTEWIGYNNYTYSPQFVDVSTYDFNVKSTSSAIGAGSSVTDSTWGTTGDTDIGIFKYYEITASGTIPTITGVTPSGAQRCLEAEWPQTTITLACNTNISATCKYDDTDTDYDLMDSTFTTTGTTSHSESLLLDCGYSYTYYIRCDSDGNKNTTSETTSFTLDKDPPPRRTYRVH